MVQVADVVRIWRGYSSDSTPSLGTSTCLECSPKKQKKKKKKIEEPFLGVPIVIQWKLIQLVSMRMQV